jgi:hypothetical protein
MEAFTMTENKNNRSPFRPLLLLSAIALAAGVAPAAWAGKISIDFTGPDSFGASSGLSMPLYTSGCASDQLNGAVGTSCNLTLTGNGSAEVALGFNVNIGGTDYSSMYINENGFVTFGAAASSAAQNSTSFTTLQTSLGATPFLAPAVANFDTGTSTPFDFFSDVTGVYYQRGMGVLGAGPYADNDPRATEAFDVFWLSNVGTDRFVSQLVLYSLADGGFAAQFNYGVDGDPNPALPGGFGGYSINGSSASFGNAFDDNLAAFRFAGESGGGGGTDPTSVPEPSALVLMAAGLVAFALTGRRRRRLTAAA